MEFLRRSIPLRYMRSFRKERNCYPHNRRQNSRIATLISTTLQRWSRPPGRWFPSSCQRYFYFAFQCKEGLPRRPGIRHPCFWHKYVLVGDLLLFLPQRYVIQLAMIWIKSDIYLPLVDSFGGRYICRLTSRCQTFQTPSGISNAWRSGQCLWKVG